MNVQFYEFEARQKIQSVLNEGKNARLFGEPSTHRFTLHKVFRNRLSQLKGYFKQVHSIPSHLSKPVVAEQGR